MNTTVDMNQQSYSMEYWNQQWYQQQDCNAQPGCKHIKYKAPSFSAGCAMQAGCSMKTVKVGVTKMPDTCYSTCETSPNNVDQFCGKAPKRIAPYLKAPYWNQNRSSEFCKKLEPPKPPEKKKEPEIIPETISVTFKESNGASYTAEAKLFRDAIQQLCECSMTMQELEDGYTKSDTDEDGSIDSDEYAAAVKKDTESKQPPKDTPRPLLPPMEEGFVQKLTEKAPTACKSEIETCFSNVTTDGDCAWEFMYMMKQADENKTDEIDKKPSSAQLVDIVNCVKEQELLQVLTNSDASVNCDEGCDFIKASFLNGTDQLIPASCECPPPPPPPPPQPGAVSTSVSVYKSISEIQPYSAARKTYEDNFRKQVAQKASEFITIGKCECASSFATCANNTGVCQSDKCFESDGKLSNVTRFNFLLY